MSVVMAGTGHLPTFRLLQQLSKRVETAPPGLGPGSPHPITYGNHMAIGMALGFLFMGGGYRTFGTSNQAVASLLISLLPRFPATSMDNSCHLQAFRHLYVLAQEPRCVQAVDVDTAQLVYAPIAIEVDKACFMGPGKRAGTGGDAAAAGVLKTSTRQNMPTDMMWSPPPSRSTTPKPPGAASDASGGAAAGDAVGRLVLGRTAPCLLPEQDVTLQLEVAGARYWPQRWQGAQDGGPGSALGKLFRQRTLFVKKKAGALAYADDPSGIRSLLSKVFVRSGKQAGAAAGMDIVDLCNTFSASPFIMAFAQHVCASPAALVQGPGGAADLAAGASKGGQQRMLQGPGGFYDFCHSALYECITQEKAGVLLWYLQLYCLMQGGCAGSGAGKGSGMLPAAAQHAVDGLTAGAGPAVGLAGLQMALAYYGSSLAAGAAVVAEASKAAGSSSSSGGGGGVDGTAVSDWLSWQPLLQPVFLHSLQQLLQNSMCEAGILRSGGSSSAAAGGSSSSGGSRTLLEQYISSGWGAAVAGSGAQLTSAEQQWRWKMLGCQLNMAGVPGQQQVQAAVQGLDEAVAQGLLPSGWRGASPMLALPVLASLLPAADVRALMMLAQHL